MTATVHPDVAKAIYHQVGDARTKTAAELDAIAAEHGLTLKELAEVCKRVADLKEALTAAGAPPIPRVAPPNQPSRSTRPAAVGVKVCTKCKKTQPLDEYHYNPLTKDNKSSQCRTCNNTGRKPTVNRIVRTRARGRAMYRLVEAHREEFQQILAEETTKAQAEHEAVAAEAEHRGHPDAPVARLKSGPKRQGQTTAIERLDVARCPKCHQFHDAGHQVQPCEAAS